MGNKNRNKNKNHQNNSTFTIKTVDTEVTSEEVLEEKTVDTVESKIPEQTEETVVIEAEVEKTEEIEQPKPNETETSDDEEDEIGIIEEEKQEEPKPVENTDKIITVAEDGKVSTHKNGREFLPEAAFIQKFVNKVCHMFFMIDKSLTYGISNTDSSFQQFRGKIDEVIENKMCGFSIFVDKNVREGHHRTVAVSLIPNETWKPEIKNGKCTNLPKGVERLVFTFDADLKESASETAYEFFVELAKARVEKVGGFLKHFLTKKMQEHKIEGKLGKISDFKPRKEKAVSTDVETKVEA